MELAFGADAQLGCTCQQRLDRRDDQVVELPRRGICVAVGIGHGGPQRLRLGVDPCHGTELDRVHRAAGAEYVGRVAWRPVR